MYHNTELIRDEEHRSYLEPFLTCYGPPVVLEKKDVELKVE